MITNETISFAKLISWLTAKTGYPFNSNDITSVADMILQMQPTPTVATVAPHQINPLLKAMQSNRKIDAIKEYRSLTGASLKDAKDNVERFWVERAIISKDDFYDYSNDDYKPAGYSR